MVNKIKFLVKLFNGEIISWKDLIRVKDIKKIKISKNNLINCEMKSSSFYGFHINFDINWELDEKQNRISCIKIK